jgi:3-hydroxy-9,10-secoandrosta-1,3,5(10)-triene-9,17-dione monooxygenase
MKRYDLPGRARELLPALVERAAEAEALRRTPDDTIKELQAADLFRALQPARYGGLEADPMDFFDAVIEVGTVCPSTAWVLGVVGVHSWQLALFDPQAQEDVWGEDDDVLIASSYAPTGTVERVDGGYLLSGRWHFSSGCDHAKWVFLGGVVRRPEGAPPPPDMRTFLLPEADYRIDDNWFVAGLAGSGSKDIVVDQAFVPEHRTHAFVDVLAIDSPGNAVNTAPLFRMPFGGLFCNAIAAPALGAARGALALFLEQCRSRVLVDKTRAVEDPFVQLRLAEVTASLDGAYLQLGANVDEMRRLAESGDKPTLERRARYRWDASRTTRVCTEAVDSIFEASGGRAIFASNTLQRAFRDIHAMRAHANNNADKTAQVFARAVLGFPNKEFLL